MIPATVNITERIAQSVTAWCFRPRRGHVALEAFLLGLFVINVRLFVACTVAVALALDAVHDRHALNAVRRVRIMQERYRRAKTRTKYRPIAAVRAVRPEVALTPLQRERRWFARMCEVRNITPVPLITHVDRTDAGRRLTLRLNAAGMTVNEFRKYEPSIAHYLGRGILDVRIANHPNHKGMCFCYIDTRDLLADSLGPWPRLAVEPGNDTITDGVLVGISGAKDEVRLDVVNDAVFVAGQRGTGKSSFLQQIVAGAVQCADVELWLGDMKEGAEFYAWAGRVARFADSPETAGGMIRELLVERERRSRELVRRKERKWHPGCGFPFILLVIDEAAELPMAGDDSAQAMLTKIVRLGRAQGIGVVLATQRPSADWISTSLRAQCNVGVSFRVRDATENSVALGPGAGDLGLRAHTLPKFQFLMLGNDAQDGVRCRGWFLSDTDVETIAGKLPRIASEVSDEPSDLVSDRTVEQAPIERPAPSDRTLSDFASRAPAAPPDIAERDDWLQLWQALPGRRKELCTRTGYGPSRCAELLGQWRDRGLVWQVGQRWEHRQVHLVRYHPGDAQTPQTGAATDGL